MGGGGPSPGSMSSASGGVAVFSIGGRMVYQRERLLNMTPEERRWRAQFLKDQQLDPDEPRYSPEYYVATNNIFRRLYRKPLDFLFKPLLPLMSKETGRKARVLTGKAFWVLAIALSSTYYLKYHKQDWTSDSGWYVIKIPEVALPGDAEYPVLPKIDPKKYYDIGFTEAMEKLKKSSQ